MRGVVTSEPAEHVPRLADTVGHMRQARLFMLFRCNVSVCTQSLEGLYFYRVHSPPSSHDGGAKPVAMNRARAAVAVGMSHRMLTGSSVRRG